MNLPLTSPPLAQAPGHRPPAKAHTAATATTPAARQPAAMLTCPAVVVAVSVTGVAVSVAVVDSVVVVVVESSKLVMPRLEQLLVIRQVLLVEFHAHWQPPSLRSLQVVLSCQLPQTAPSAPDAATARVRAKCRGAFVTFGGDIVSRRDPGCWACPAGAGTTGA
eukprot:CAMPEP_0168423252 /NCGR_PEP_ID=MMETSP0228-20121227/34214_1 /TAXON_ID=133427 /ORGANISM="Protoceratium reticulatum, Strain CCCM 535 (=CCMP 1889)" /LENGTH=163 /DNA_ID=CAMNT_0008437211 /DNA_START=116 /DNA_END=607 /DNA_ORIENTATION=-